jgi:hypothetical protein
MRIVMGRIRIRIRIAIVIRLHSIDARKESFLKYIVGFYVP